MKGLKIRRSVKRTISAALASIISVSVISASFVSASNFETVKLPNYPGVIQHGPNCWASTLYSMGLYKGLNLAMTEQVIGYFYAANGYHYTGNGATLYETYRVADYMFSGYDVQWHASQLHNGEIMDQIDDDLPVCIGGVSSDGGGHMVALMGYKKGTFDNNVYRIYYMNPQTGLEYSHSYSISLNVHEFTNASETKTYIWNASITLE